MYLVAQQKARKPPRMESTTIFQFLVITTTIKRIPHCTILLFLNFKIVIPYLLFERFTLKFASFLFMCTKTNCSMVQWGIILMVVVMKRNRKIVVPSISGGLLWRVPRGACIIIYSASMLGFEVYLYSKISR